MHAAYISYLYIYNNKHDNQGGGLGVLGHIYIYIHTIQYTIHNIQYYTIYNIQYTIQYNTTIITTTTNDNDNDNDE
mgnify:CR=1 FL=1